MWDTTGFGNLTPTDHVLIQNITTGLVTFDVTADINAYAADTLNVGWYLTKPSNNNNQKIIFRSRERPEKPRLILYTTQDAEVPPEAPDALPDWVYSPANLDSNTTAIPGVFVKNIVVVQFKPIATATQWQAAISAVQGTVIGGIRFDPIEGSYYVQVVDTEGGVVLRNAVQTLKGLSYINSASIEYAMELAYRRPRDSGDWSQWRLNPDLADGDNWGLEAIAAPAAWGCSVGDDNIRIATVDGGMYGEDGPDDLHFSYHLASGGAPALSEHGFRVLSVLGADGDNEMGMTGLMWKSDLHGYEAGLGLAATPFILRVTGQILSAALDGARVINVSIAGLRRWPHADRVAAGEILRITLEAVNGLPNPPLVVLAAGNNGLVADSSGFPLANSPKHPRLIVVAGSDRQHELYEVGTSKSNYGPLVDVAAPGHDIYTLGLNNEPALVFGTSFAAPIVSGIAGLLVSFDPSLTAEDLKTLIVAGAQLDSVSGPGGPYPFVNAYESMKHAAKRQGAPLCGNRTYLRGDTVYTYRAGGPEALGVISTGVSSAVPIRNLAVEHGGKIVSLCTIQGQCLTGMKYENGIWISDQSGGGWRGTNSGAARSILALNHDADSALFVGSNGSGDGVYNISLRAVGQSQGRHLGTITGRAADNHTVGMGSLSPQGDFVLLVDHWGFIVGCCEWTYGSDLYRMSTADGSYTMIATRPGDLMMRPQISEDGANAVLNIIFAGSASCATQYLSLPSGSLQDQIEMPPGTCSTPTPGTYFRSPLSRR